MPIDYQKIRPQIEKMGRMLAYKTQDISERGQNAFHQFDGLPDNEAVMAQVEIAREKDAGYRGAAPFAPDQEPVTARIGLPEAPSKATVLAVDGSQIYPDIHAAALFYVVNVGLFTFYHGQNRLPVEYNEPYLAYSDSEVRDQYDQVITNAVVNARRTIEEMDMLSSAAWEIRTSEQPVFALYDGRLLFWLGNDVPDALNLMKAYRAAMVRFHDTSTYAQPHNISVGGYVDRPTSRFVINMLELMRLDESEITRYRLSRPGEYEGLDDRWLFTRWLKPGERSALMIQQSPQNKEYKQDWGASYEIVFFYVNVGTLMEPHIARIEIPMWVAKNAQAVREAHALVVAQCKMAGNFPYALIRADEIAVIRGLDRQTLITLINTELIRQQQQPDISDKLSGKLNARYTRQSFSLNSPKHPF